MNGDAGTFAGSVETGQQAGAAHVRLDAAHGVVHGWPNRYGLIDRVHAGDVHGQLVDLRQALQDLLPAQVTQV